MKWFLVTIRNWFQRLSLITHYQVEILEMRKPQVGPTERQGSCTFFPLLLPNHFFPSPKTRLSFRSMSFHFFSTSLASLVTPHHSLIDSTPTASNSMASQFCVCHTSCDLFFNPTAQLFTWSYCWPYHPITFWLCTLLFQAKKSRSDLLLPFSYCDPQLMNKPINFTTPNCPNLLFITTPIVNPNHNLFARLQLNFLHSL